MSDEPAGRSYALPTETLPAESLEASIARLVQFETLCAHHGVSTRGTRIERYLKYLEWCAATPAALETLDRGIFVDAPESPVRHGLDRFLYVLREAHELAWISGGLAGLDIPGLEMRLSTIISGADLAALDRNTGARNIQFELRIASYFARAGYALDLSTLTDIVARGSDLTFHVECKRIASPKQLTTRIKEAVSQLRTRLPRNASGHGHFGLVAADVTKVAFSHNGLTRGVTPEHARDVIHDKLKLVARQLDPSDAGAVNAKRVLGLWLQIHIPSLVMAPFQPTTRFSSYLLPNRQLTLRGRVAELRLWQNVMGVKTGNDDDLPPTPLRLRAALKIPEGTLVSWDEDLLTTLQRDAALPDLPRDHVVMSVAQPGSEVFEDFLMEELSLLLGSMTGDERRAAFAGLDQSRSFLLGGLLARRYPYREQATWLNDEGA